MAGIKKIDNADSACEGDFRPAEFILGKYVNLPILDEKSLSNITDLQSRIAAATEKALKHRAEIYTFLSDEYPKLNDLVDELFKSEKEHYLIDKRSLLEKLFKNILESAYELKLINADDLRNLSKKELIVKIQESMSSEELSSIKDQTIDNFSKENDRYVNPDFLGKEHEVKYKLAVELLVQEVFFDELTSLLKARELHPNQRIDKNKNSIIFALTENYSVLIASAIKNILGRVGVRRVDYIRIPTRFSAPKSDSDNYTSLREDVRIGKRLSARGFITSSPIKKAGEIRYNTPYEIERSVSCGLSTVRSTTTKWR